MAFFGCLVLRRPAARGSHRPAPGNLLSLPEHGWGEMRLTHSQPRSGAKWTDSGKSRERRELKHRAAGDTRLVPVHPELVDAAPRSPRQVRRRPGTARLHRPARRHRCRMDLPGGLPRSPRGSTQRRRRRHTADEQTLRPAPRRRLDLAQRGRPRRPGRRVGRAQHRRAAAGLRQVHRRPARRGQAPHRGRHARAGTRPAGQHRPGTARGRTSMMTGSPHEAVKLRHVFGTATRTGPLTSRTSAAHAGPRKRLPQTAKVQVRRYFCR